MGLLDDAIREHLELKRQHGADPEEVSRQENEALGAARRAEFARTGEAADEAATDAPAAAPDETEPVAESPAAPVEDLAPPPPEDFVPPPEPVAEEPVAPPEPAPREPFDVEAVEPAPPAADEPSVPEPSAPEPPSETRAWLEDEPDEVPADEALDRPRAAGDEESREDVLEETPDFLQETPEHDRLWFEQRPPRDFDWDK
jgi:hypothetical protein